MSALFAKNTFNVIKAFFKWAEVFVLTLLIVYSTRYRKSFSQLYWLLFIACFGFVIFGLLIIFRGQFSAHNYRLPGGYESVFALALLAPFMKKNRKVIIISISCVLVVLLSFSRGAWIAVLPIIFYLGSEAMKKHKKMIIFLPIIIAFIFYISSETFRQILSWRFITAFDSGSASNIERWGMAKIALSAFSSSPLFGIGALNYSSYLVEYADPGIIRSEVVATLTPHNFFLEILSELGLIGFCAFCLILASIFFALHYAHRKKNEYLIDNNQLQGLTLFIIVYLISITLGYVAGHFRFYMALLFGSILSYTKMDYEENTSKTFDCNSKL